MAQSVLEQAGPARVRRAVAPGRGSAGPGRPRTGRHRLAPYLFIAPGITLFTLFLLIPIGYSVYLSFFSNKVSSGIIGASERASVFVGFENFAAILEGSVFWSGLARAGYYGLLVIPITLGLALVFALALDVGVSKLRTVSKTIIFIPYAVPGVIATLMWGYMYHERTSPFGDIFTFFGFPTPDFLGDSLVFYSIVNIAVWGGIGFNMIILHTALSGIPREIYEAARIDGASELRIAIQVKLPLVVPSMIFTLLFGVIGAVQVYAEPQTMKTMSPSITSGWVPLMEIQRLAFEQGETNMAAAGAIIIALIAFGLSLLVFRLAGKKGSGD
ncbi:carbohydrate ABC transporter permease [Mycetocola sp. JXN-3]|uniref:carbohydrate ABC transporter permease n=1 Tax=Mycetocola sp. JXN-3 TaxID=2116510 RepID=UPI00165D1F13|nr:sugar ABC transporter permease [Mycetocola sp. JXN-3]